MGGPSSMKCTAVCCLHARLPDTRRLNAQDRRYVGLAPIQSLRDEDMRRQRSDTLSSKRPG
jgi:hypothetical protein